MLLNDTTLNPHLTDSLPFSCIRMKKYGVKIFFFFTTRLPPSEDKWCISRFCKYVFRSFQYASSANEHHHSRRSSGSRGVRGTVRERSRSRDRERREHRPRSRRWSKTLRSSVDLRWTACFAQRIFRNNVLHVFSRLWTKTSKGSWDSFLFLTLT